MDRNIEIKKCEAVHLETAVELTYIAWEPIFEKYRESLGDKMFYDLYGDWKIQKYNRISKGLLSGRGYVALVNGEVAGFIFYIVDEEKKKGTMEENAVHPKFRGQGIAAKMHNFVFDKMREEGMKYVEVTTGLDEAHAAARRAYEKAGFDKTLENVRYFREL